MVVCILGLCERGLEPKNTLNNHQAMRMEQQLSSYQRATRDLFEKSYKVGHVLGKGGFGVVYSGQRNSDGLQVAIKHVSKAKIKDWAEVGREVVFSFFYGRMENKMVTNIC